MKSKYQAKCAIINNKEVNLCCCSLYAALIEVALLELPEGTKIKIIDKNDTTYIAEHGVITNGKVELTN